MMKLLRLLYEIAYELWHEHRRNKRKR